MRDRTMIRLGLLFMAVTIVTGVNHAISSYNHMMGTPEAPRAFVINRGDEGIVEIGVLGQRLNMPDPVKVVDTRTPVWREKGLALRNKAAEFYERALVQIKQLQMNILQQKQQTGTN